ncbi:MAG: sulfur carrier protein ThiS [Promethearchaeota archaeon]
MIYTPNQKFLKIIEFNHFDMIQVNNRPLEWKKGLTVQKLLKIKNYTFPNITVKINNVFIPKNEYQSTVIQDGDNVLILHMFGGG